MKYFLLITLAFLIYSNAAYTQSCTGITPIKCSDKKVISPTIAQAINVGLASASCTNLTVNWTGSADQEYIVKATYRNSATNTIDTIAATDIEMEAANGKASIPVIAGNQYTISVEAKNITNGCPLYSYPAISRMEYPVALCNGSGVLFSGKAFLQGAFNPATGIMGNDLNKLGILQVNASLQPYNTVSFNYTGAEKAGDNFFASHPDIVDWVLLELSDPNVPSTVVAKRAVFLKQNGDLIDIDGSNTQISFPNIAAGSYYVTIRHRNHLSIRSVTPVSFSGSVGSYDFTTAHYKSFQNQPYPSPVQMGNVWVLRGGNANVNLTTKYSGPLNDQNQILNVKLGGSLSRIINNVYAPEDVNMNGNIKWSGPGSDQNFLLNGVLAGSLSAILTEQF